MKCTCGSETFYANQRCYHTVIVDSDGSFQEDIETTGAEKPYGPFECIDCFKVYDELKDN